jgi:hypothetical protein
MAAPSEKDQSVRAEHPDPFDMSNSSQYYEDMLDWCVNNNPSREEVADRFLSLYHGLASVGEALLTANALQNTRAEELPAEMRSTITDISNEQQYEAHRSTTRQQARKQRAHTRNTDMQDFVVNDAQDGGISTDQIPKADNQIPRVDNQKKQKEKKRKEKEIEEDSEGEEDLQKQKQSSKKNAAAKLRAANKCPFEKASVDKVTPSGKDSAWASAAAANMRDLKDDVNSTQSKALQNLLLYIFSFDAVQEAAVLAEQTRANAKTMQVAAAVGMVKKTTHSTLSDMSKAISKLLLTEAATTIIEFQSLMEHVSTAQLLTDFVDSIINGTSPLCQEYHDAVSVDKHPYLVPYTRASVRKYVVEQSTIDTFDEHATGSRAGASEKWASNSRATIEKALRIGETLMWLTDAFGHGVVVLIAGTQWRNW